MKGVVLAAGFGTRLRPLTEKFPKPLIPFRGVTPLELSLFRLRELGVTDVAVNAHYLADQIEKLCAARPFGLTPRLSYEPEILGTGGCYNPLRDWQGHDELLVVNGDIVTDIDLRAVVAAHRAAGAAATMALLPEVIPGQNAVFHQNGQIVGIAKTGPDGAERGNFACVQVLTRGFVELLPASGSFDVIQHGYLAALARGWKIAAYVHRGGYWHDIGSVKAVAAGIFDPRVREQCDTCLKSLRRQAVYRDAYTAVGGAHIDPTAVLGPDVVVEDGGVVEARAKLKRVIVLPGARVAAGSVYESQIIGLAEPLAIPV